MENEKRNEVQGLHHELESVDSGRVDFFRPGFCAEFRFEKTFEGIHRGFQLFMQRTGAPCVKSGGTAGGQTAKRIGFLDQLQVLFDPIDQPTCLANGFKDLGFRGFSVR